MCQLRAVVQLVGETFGERFKHHGALPLPLLLATPRELANLFGTGIPGAIAFKSRLAGVVRSRFHLVDRPDLSTALQGAGSDRVPTGHPGIDFVLHGGVSPRSVVQLFGPPASGKTEMVYHLARAFLAASNDATVHVIDADARFQPRRLMEHGVSTGDLRKVHVSRCHSLHHLGLLLDAVARAARAPDAPSLIVLDSIVAPALRASVDDAVSRQVELARLLDKMRAIATGQAVVLFTNLSTAEGLLPAGGDLLVARSTHVLRLARDPVVPGRCSVAGVKVPGPERAGEFSIGPAGLLP